MTLTGPVSPGTTYCTAGLPCVVHLNGTAPGLVSGTGLRVIASGACGGTASTAPAAMVPGLASTALPSPATHAVWTRWKAGECVP